MQDYEIETIAKIRAMEPLPFLSNNVIRGMYNHWSEETYCAGWITDGETEFVESIRPEIEEMKSDFKARALRLCEKFISIDPHCHSFELANCAMRELIGASYE